MRLALITCAALAASSAAAAQSEEFATAFREDAREVRLIGARYGDCVVTKEAKSAAAFIAMLPDSTKRSAAGDRLIAKINDGPCLVKSSNGFGDVQMRFPGDNMRYTLADALFRSQLSGAPVIGRLTAVPRLVHPTLDESLYQPKPGRRLSAARTQELAASRDREMARIYLSQFGECVVRTDPAAAFALLSTKVVTPEENGAFAKLQPALAQCVSEGSKVELNKAVLRGTIAMNYYRLARQQGITPGGGAGRS